MPRRWVWCALAFGVVAEEEEQAFPTMTSSTPPSRRVIDSHLHIWSDGKAPFAWEVPPPDELQSTVTMEAMLEAASQTSVVGALIVQPINHKFDHTYVATALKARPDFFRGMCLANPTLPSEDAVAELSRLHAEDGFVGVRFNPALFPSKSMLSDVGRALFKKAGALNMPVGVMAFTGLTEQYTAEIVALLELSPETKVVIDHFGFFRQPATGGFVAKEGAPADNLEDIFQGLLELSKFPQVYVKVSALFRVSGEPFPHLDLQPRIAKLLEKFGPGRCMWGSDFPYVLLGGHERNTFATTYKDAVAVFEKWNSTGAEANKCMKEDECANSLSETESWVHQIQYHTAAKLFGF